jgi:AcrR family transcriptional regulator
MYREHKPKMKDQIHRGPREQRGILEERILRTARASFASNGYAGTSLRSVAVAAGVDPALLHYYFQNKRGLLEAALVPPVDFLEGIAQASAVPMQQRGRSLVEAMVTIWEQPEAAETLRSIILTAAYEPIALQRLQEIFAIHIFKAVVENLPDDEKQLRVGLVASQLVGLAMTRYVWQVGALVDLSPAQIVDLIAPTIQRYLYARLPKGILSSQYFCTPDNYFQDR